MKVTKACCQGCGADLQIDETIRFVTCNYCNARLEVVHDTTVTHTRQLDKIEKTTDGKLRLGVQLVAARYREDLILEAGEVIEAAEGPILPVDPQ